MTASKTWPRERPAAGKSSIMKRRRKPWRPFGDAAFFRSFPPEGARPDPRRPGGVLVAGLEGGFEQGLYGPVHLTQAQQPVAQIVQSPARRLKPVGQGAKDLGQLILASQAMVASDPVTRPA